MQKRSPIKIVIATLIVRKAIVRSPLATLFQMFRESAGDSVVRRVNIEIDSYNKSHPDAKPLPSFPVSERGKKYNNRVNGPIRLRVVEEDAEVVLVYSREDAEAVLDRMAEIIKNYNFASVSDLRDIVDYDTSTSDHSRGWTTLEGVEVKKVEGGWVMRFPTPKEVQ